MKANTTSIIVAVTLLLACVVQARYTDDDLDRLVLVDIKDDWLLDILPIDRTPAFKLLRKKT